MDDQQDASKMEEGGSGRVSFSVDLDENNGDKRTQFGSKAHQFSSVRHDISFKKKTFDIRTLPKDVQRVYKKLEAESGEEYALIWVFSMRTAIELHRGWHMPLLTSKILQQIKDKFNMRMTWNLGVVKLIFRVEDGGFELQRKIPFDYDSEYQDLYTKVASALVNDYIDIHEALLFQTEIKKGLHTAKSGVLLMRSYPGRLLVYPLLAASCALIFFGGDWSDAGVAAICGLASGLVEWSIDSLAPGDFKILKDVVVGVSTGIIASLFFRFDNQGYCLRSIFLGTLYWFFYGTAFVAGILEIVAGELETGVTRFVAVAIKTFVLSMGAAFGMAIVMTGDLTPYESWVLQGDNCGKAGIIEDDPWMRLLIYVVCSYAVLCQYRFPFVKMWRSLLVQVVGYQVQYRAQDALLTEGKNDNLDTAISNIVGAVAAVVFSEFMAGIVDYMLFCYNARVLHRNKKATKIGALSYKVTAFFIRLNHFLGLGKESDLAVLNMKDELFMKRMELHDENHERSEITLTREQERNLQDAVVNAEPLNTWAILMPAVYQLVPGSQIANLWFSTIFPFDEDLIRGETKVLYPKFTELLANYKASESGEVFSLLMVISTSLALGLLIGFAISNNGARALGYLKQKLGFDKILGEDSTVRDLQLAKYGYRKGLMSVGVDDDPADRNEESVRNLDA